MPSQRSITRVTGSEPIFAAADVRAAIAFYRDVVGFSGEWYSVAHGSEH